MLEFTPNLDYSSEKPLYIQLSDYIKKEMIAGKIPPGEKLPSKRKLSEYLDLSINTIQAAYDQLKAEGYIESKERKGLFAVNIENEIFFDQSTSPKVIKKDLAAKEKIMIDFSSGKVDLASFPYSVWRKLTAESLYEDQSELFNVGDPQGEPALREEISKYLFASRGVKCTSEQIVIGAGTQVLIGLASLLIGKNEPYALENPGFHRTRTVLQDLGITTVSIPLDENGICMEPLRASGAKVVYVTPSHQFPFGMIMPIARRMELLHWARKREGYIIEDDYDGEFRYKGRPIPSLQGLDESGRVIYLGTFSKSLIPSIRLGYLVLPPSLLRIYQQHFTLYKNTVSRLHQKTLIKFMNQGYWQRHLNRMRTLYHKKQSVLMAAIHQYMGSRVDVIGEKSGLHIVVYVKNGMSEQQLVKSALDSGIKVYPVSVYFADCSKAEESRILLGFGGLSIPDIQKGIQSLSEIWFDGNHR